MKKKKLLLFIICSYIAGNLHAQGIISVGKGSYAAYPPEAVAYEDGYFAAPYRWFEQAWPDLNLHENVRNRPLPTNKWWTEFIFRGLGRIQPEYHLPPVTVTTTGDRFGCEAWAYPHMVTASTNGFNVFFPKGFSGGGMVKGNPLKIHATFTLQTMDENILFEDFETPVWPEGWKVTNNTHNITGPTSLSEITQVTIPVGYTGERFANTHKGNEARITLISPIFTIEKNYIRLLVGGGNHPDDAYVGLFINGVRIFSETGQNNGNLTPRTWDVSDYKGQQAEIRIVDSHTGGWGYIMCDEIVFTDSPSGGAGYTPEFGTAAAKVYDWTDLGFTLRSESENKWIDATIIHGVPFVYFELNNLYPLLVPGGNGLTYDEAGNQIENFPVSLHSFTIEYDDRVYGVHVPSGSRIHRSNGGDFQIETPADKRYVVVSVLPDRSLLKTYDRYARNKPGNVLFTYDYDVEKGRIETTFEMDASHLETGATNQEVLMSFLPHHYRTTDKNFGFIDGADYRMFIGQMHTGAASSFSLSYPFGGMPPYLPEPVGMPQNRQERLNSLLTYSSNHSGRNGNTYAKGLGEQGTLMLMAKAMDHLDFDRIKTALKEEFIDWLTFDESEKTKKSYYFANYPHYGALIGFPPGYGSQGFNDLHFHNGYFTVGAARLMMVDKEFKKDFSEMVKLVTKTYANWERADETQVNTADYQPFLRTFDPYLGHSFAGGTGDGGGNNQESTSEAINSWFGLYMLGVELNDQQMLTCGAMGYMLENMAAGEYWLDMYKENFPATYNREYVGILRTDNLAWATYFSGDPAWMLGIQACPVDFYYSGFTMNKERMKEINAAMFHDRTTTFYEGNPMHTNDDPYDNIKTMGPYLGGYHLNIMNFMDPVNAAEWIDQFCNLPGKEGEEWRNHINTTTNYYMSNAMITYGNPAPGYHTSIPSGAVYQNENGELTYLLYNATDKDVDVHIYKEGTITETIKVKAGVYYNSRFSAGRKPNAEIITYKDGDKLALNKKVKIEASATDKDGTVLWVDFYFDGNHIGSSYIEPYEVFFAPDTPGIKELTVIATDNDGMESDPATVTVEVLAIEQTPYHGKPWNIPEETIYAVQFDEGGPEIACHDNEIEMMGGDNYREGTGVETENTRDLPNSNIGFSNSGEWFEYTIYAERTGVYLMSARLSSAIGGDLCIFMDGVDKTGIVEIESTGSWGNFSDMEIASIPLHEGTHIMRVLIDRRGANLNSFKFTFLPEETMPPDVDAGQDRVILYPQENTILVQAIVKTYGEAKTEKIEWTQKDSNHPAAIMSPTEAETLISDLQPGTYVFEVKVTDSNGKTAKDRIVILVKDDGILTLEEDIYPEKILVYPNPFKEKLIIKPEKDHRYEKLTLCSLTGNILIQEDINNRQEIHLNVSGLKSGYYILSLFSKEKQFITKVFKIE